MGIENSEDNSDRTAEGDRGEEKSDPYPSYLEECMADFGFPPDKVFRTVNGRKELTPEFLIEMARFGSLIYQDPREIVEHNIGQRLRKVYFRKPQTGRRRKIPGESCGKATIVLLQAICEN